MHATMEGDCQTLPATHLLKLNKHPDIEKAAPMLFLSRVLRHVKFHSYGVLSHDASQMQRLAAERLVIASS